MASRIILGVSNLDVRSHDNAACILVDGQLIAQAEEERFTRKKHAYDTYPTSAVRYCLERAGIKLQELDAIAVGWDLPRTTYDRKQTPVISADESEIIRQLTGETLKDDLPPLHYIPHHLSHAAVTYYASGFRRAAILVVDGAGEFEATTYWQAEGNDIRKLRSQDQNPDSLGFMYEGVCEYLGFNGNEAGKVMALASYSNTCEEPFDVIELGNGYRVHFPRSIYEEVLREFDAKENYYTMDLIKEFWIRYCESLYGERAQFRRRDVQVGDALFREKSRIANKLQISLEQALLHSARAVREQTSEENLCLSGGVALNCSANGKLDRSGIFKRTYQYPPSNDAGVALGAAMHVWQSEENNASLDRHSLTQMPYWGPEYSDEDIEDLLRRSGTQYTPCTENFEDIAELIQNGDVVAWFQGRMEIGPRALGGRSILADPRNAELRDRVNHIKGRELWRPLAPSVLEGFESEYFEPGTYSPFMLKAAIVKPDKRSVIPAVTHIDNTCRYQSVSRGANPRYWQLIEAFREGTGVPMVLNTSFNHKGPIVCSPEDALHTFHARNIDHLVLGKFRISKSSPQTP